MNKNVKSLIDKAKDGIGKSLRVVKRNKKVQIGIVSSIVLVTVAGGTFVYVKYNNGKAEGNKLEIAEELLEEAEETQESEADIILTENENGELVATDKEGNIVAEGDEVEKLVEEKKEKGETVVAKTESGTTVKVDKVDGDKVTSSSGQPVKPTTKPPVVADNNNNNTSKPSTGIDKPSTDNNSGNSNNNNNNSGTNKPSNGNNNGSSNNGGSTSKPQEPSKPTPPVGEQPKPEVNPEPPKRTWTYMADMSRETFKLMNKFRQDNGVAPLKWSDSEHVRAKKQAENNASKGDGGHEFMQISLITKRSTSQGFIDLWKNSASHKESMLEKNFIEGAVAVYKDSDGVYYAVASFNDGW